VNVLEPPVLLLLLVNGSYDRHSRDLINQMTMMQGVRARVCAAQLHASVSELLELLHSPFQQFHLAVRSVRLSVKFGSSRMRCVALRCGGMRRRAAL